MAQEMLFCNTGFLLKPAVIYKDMQRWFKRGCSTFTNEDQLS